MKKKVSIFFLIVFFFLFQNKQIFAQIDNAIIISVGDYPITYPLVLSVEEFEALVLKKQLRKYFKNKIVALSGKGNNIDDLQKNLLPESYVNKNFFQSFLYSITSSCKIGNKLNSLEFIS